MQSNAATVYYTNAPAPVSSVGDPTKSSQVAELYKTGMIPATLAPNLMLIPAFSNVVIKAIAEKADGSLPSTVSYAEFDYVTASPTIEGINAADLKATCSTAGAVMYYTTDGTDPDQTSQMVKNSSLSFPITQDTQLKIRAYNDGDNFAPSGIISKTLYLSDYVANRLVWGFDGGEGASFFDASPGQSFYAPVGLILIPGQDVYSFQFDAWVVRSNTVPGISELGFFPLVLYQLSNSPAVYTNIVPNYNFQFQMTSNLVVYTNASGTNSELVGAGTNVSGTPLYTNFVDGLSTAWVTLVGTSNYYDTTKQDLVKYWTAHSSVHEDKDSVLLGAVRVKIPTDAPVGTNYQIELANASGADGNNEPVLVQTLTLGSLRHGTMNSTKSIAIGSPKKYLVGSVVPFYWYNAGEFGTNTFGSADVVEALKHVLTTAPIFRGADNLGTNVPPDSDVFNAMDSSGGAVETNWAAVPDLEAGSINSMTMGDGSIGVDDLYVTFRRSLDPTLKWYNRYWDATGHLTSEETPNLLARPTNVIQGLRAKSATKLASDADVNSGPHSLRVTPGLVRATAGQTVEVPITVEVTGKAPLRTMLIGAKVIPLDGSPAIETPINFTEADDLTTSSQFSISQAANEFGGVWLDSQVVGVSGTNGIGSFTVPIPASANAKAAYLVHFTKFSASPNGLAIFPATVEDTVITLADRSQSSWNDGISDAWRLRYFGTVSNLLSSADADADVDGASNYAEFLAGTNPMDIASKPQQQAPNAPTLGLFRNGSEPTSGFTLQWAAEINRQYSVEISWDLFSTNWTPISTNIMGEDGVATFTDTNVAGRAKFYRVRAQ
jgi:hypothetical protein